MASAAVLPVASGALHAGYDAAAGRSAIDWASCPLPDLPTRECGTMTLPLDYDRPLGLTVTIAVARVPATDPANRIGSLILNPGGPGGNGVGALPLMYGALPAPLPARFDVVSFDPRGVGESTPVRCFDSAAEQQAYFADYPTIPVGPEEIGARKAKSVDLAARCLAANGDLLSHLSTANVARDMDMLRQAVGDDRLTYLGASYGTFLGATYANLFPDRVRAIALDGVIDPPSFENGDHGVSEVAGEATNSMLRITSDQGTLLAFDEFLNLCVAAGPERCTFAGATVAETRARYDALMKSLLTQPVASPASGEAERVTYSSVVEATRGALYSASEFQGLAEGLTALEKGDVHGFVEATHGLAKPDPSIYQNVKEALPAINCSEADHPRNDGAFAAMVTAANERSPWFGEAWAYLLEPCTFWPARDEDRYAGPWNRERSAPILIVSRRFDPATPHASAEAAVSSLGDARLLTIDGWGHSYFEGGRSTCANDDIAAYLIDGVLPPPGKVCAEDKPPFE
jgi:pimeloyl-ACP methyl ester carboxylesterase